MALDPRHPEHVVAMRLDVALFDQQRAALNEVIGHKLLDEGTTEYLKGILGLLDHISDNI